MYDLFAKFMLSYYYSNIQMRELFLGNNKFLLNSAGSRLTNLPIKSLVQYTVRRISTDEIYLMKVSIEFI